jgi:RNA polymerase sigma-54 factor
MKAGLQTSLGQQLVMTPQLRQAIRLLQMSAAELEAEIALAVESNPLLEWDDEADAAPASADEAVPAAAEAPADEPAGPADEGDWNLEDPAWTATGGGSFDGEEDNPAERIVAPLTLADHLLEQLRLSPISARDLAIATTLVDALEEDGYLRVPLADIAAALLPEIRAGEDEIHAVLRLVQGLDPVGVGAADLAECLRLQLLALPGGSPGRALALRIVDGPLERLPRAGVAGVAAELGCPREDAEAAIALLRSLDPRPGKRIGEVDTRQYVTPDAVIWRQHGVWQAALAAHAGPKVTIHHGYEQLIRRCGEADASYLRSQLQEARWLIKGLEARGETLLKVVRSLLRYQAGFLEFGAQALRPLTLREIAAELGLHESTISRAIAGKYVRTPRGTLPLRAFFASGIETGSGGEASSTAIQAMIKRLIEAENPRKPLSDAKLADLLKTSGVPVARRTVAKYREAMNIAASHERVRIA